MSYIVDVNSDRVAELEHQILDILHDSDKCFGESMKALLALVLTWDCTVRVFAEDQRIQEPFSGSLNRNQEEDQMGDEESWTQCAPGPVPMLKLFVFVSFIACPTPLQQKALFLGPTGGTRSVCSLDPAVGPSNLLALGSGDADGRRCLVSRLLRILRVAKGGRVPLQPQTATRTRITVRTITLQLAWTPLKGLISCKRIEVSVIREDTVSGLLPGATHPPEAPAWPPCTPPHTNQSQLGLCVVFLGNWNADSSSSSTGPLSSVSRRLQKLAAEEAVQVRELLLGFAYQHTDHRALTECWMLFTCAPYLQGL
ncbi:uncharacterized protein LOC125156966 [Prionailurus viverrinus]|uniref:uncharacterized protein LOC125156966 n=1 Tax=Prionailurus viverrinus TaxID=61388 RepID=UPI001FF57C3F|nr:uncharacterized protein LOC125156966 [Prionailurus viverrinus]